MRLLNCQKLLDNPNSSDALESFYTTPPPYAILSHTWELEEVSLHDLSRPDVCLKAGFDKIRYCCREALSHNLAYAWVDTCCIDKSSSAELSETINSMFQWYAEAKVCYVYLHDVTQLGSNQSTLPLSTGKSRWFTRGWTLQELLAPNIVVFYNTTWHKLGTKVDSIDALSEITGIDGFYFGLRARERLRSASIAQKMSWAARRTTTRPEDMAYSLLGILDINMPLLYGEGTRAFRRLQEELMRQFHDHSMFAWGLSVWGLEEPHLETAGLLAPSPKYFLGSGEFVPTQGRSHLEVPVRIPHGVQLHVHLSTGDYGPSAQKYMLLDCHRRTDLHRVLAIPIDPINGGAAWERSRRARPRLLSLSLGFLQRKQSISVMETDPVQYRVIYDELHHHLGNGLLDEGSCILWIQKLPVNYCVEEVLPETSWFPTNTIEIGIPRPRPQEEKEEKEKKRAEKGEMKERLVKMVSAHRNQAIILRLQILEQRTSGLQGFLALFQKATPAVSCLMTSADQTLSLRSIQSQISFYKWSKDLHFPDLGSLVVGIGPRTTMGWNLTAISLSFSLKWSLRFRVFWSGLKSQNILQLAAMLTIILALLMALASIVRAVTFICWQSSLLSVVNIVGICLAGISLAAICSVAVVLIGIGLVLWEVSTNGELIDRE